MGNRMTSHSGRITHAKAKHLDRDNVTAEHINSEKSRLNRYWNMYDGEYAGKSQKEHFTMTDTEKVFYLKMFEEHIRDVNARADKSGHKENRTSVSRLLTSKKTMPQDSIFQVGSVRDDIINPTDLWNIWREFMDWHKATYPQVTIMDCAMHMDESVPHIHDRRVYWYRDDGGTVRIGQEKALEQMGVPLPDPNKPRGRFNNRKQTYSRECREYLMELCREYGYEIIDKPLENRKHNLKKEDAIVQELRNDRDTLLKEKKSLMMENDELKRRIEYMEIFNAFVAEAEAEGERQRSLSRGRER